KSTVIADYVTESGYTTEITGRSKVGSAQGSSELFIYDREKDTVLAIRQDSIAGIHDLPDYVKDYPKQLEQRQRNQLLRQVTFSIPDWSPRGSHAVIEVRAQDH